MRSKIYVFLAFLLVISLFQVNPVQSQTHSAYVYYLDDSTEVPIDNAEVTFRFGSGTGSGTFYTDIHGMAYTTHACDSSCALRVSVNADGYDPVNPASGEYRTHCDAQHHFPFLMEPADHASIKSDRQTVFNDLENFLIRRYLELRKE